MTEQEYSDAFVRLGRPLTARDGVSGDEIAEAERRLGCVLPRALTAFYRVAGRATDFTDHYDHFLAPSDWSLTAGKLVFLEENQAVVIYAVDVGLPSPDPPVFMTTNQEPFEWYEVCGRCSEFLNVMTYWEGAFGGAMPATASAAADMKVRERLDRQFQSIGEVNEMRAYSRAGTAVCLVQWDGEWRIFVGASNDVILEQVENDLGGKLER
jgi:hypothetical protein